MEDKITHKFNLPAGWKIINSSDTHATVSVAKNKVKQKQYLEKGSYPVIDQGQEFISGYFEDENFLVTDKPPYIVFGDHTKSIKFINFRFVAGADGVKILKPYHFILPKLFYYFLRAIKLPDRGYSRHYQFLKNIDFPIPPLAEQQRIVAKIETLFSSLDKGIETLKTTQQQLKIYRQAVLKAAFEGRFTNDTINDGELPKNWIILAINDIADVRTGATPLKGNKEYYYEGKIPWVTSGALNDEFVNSPNDYVTEKALRETNLTVFSKGTLLVAMYGEGKTRGKCSELAIEACTNQAVAAIILKNEKKELKKYVKFFLLKNYYDFRKLAAGGVQPNLNLSIVKNASFPIPQDIKKVTIIVQEIESRLSVCDKIEETIVQSLKQTEALRQSILKKAFEGKLVPQDPNDESASVLLERIKADRGATATPAKKTRIKKVKP
jgi:type I restriction enzyme S subunit